MIRFRCMPNAVENLAEKCAKCFELTLLAIIYAILGLFWLAILPVGKEFNT